MLADLALDFAVDPLGPRAHDLREQAFLAAEVAGKSVSLEAPAREADDLHGGVVKAKLQKNPARPLLQFVTPLLAAWIRLSLNMILWGPSVDIA